MKRRTTTTRRPSPDREQRRQEILRAAIQLFAERGMENVTFGDIAKAARLSRPLVYFYFPDLEALFMEAVILGSAKVHQRFLHAVRPAMNGLDQIMAIGAAYVQFARDEPQLFQLLAHKETKQSATEKTNPLDDECHQRFGEIMGLLVAALHKGHKDGSIRSDLGDPEKVAICLWGLTHGLIQVAANQLPTIERKLGAAGDDLPDFGLDLLRRSLAAPRRSRS
jgi:AcrR family transcriptional regulator